MSAISDVELNILSQLMKSNPSVIVQINGHTDDVGTEQSNILLSQQRADAVVKRLIQLGIPAKSLLAKGYGESRPVWPIIRKQDDKEIGGLNLRLNRGWRVGELACWRVGVLGG